MADDDIEVDENEEVGEDDVDDLDEPAEDLDVDVVVDDDVVADVVADVDVAADVVADVDDDAAGDDDEDSDDDDSATRARKRKGTDDDDDDDDMVAPDDVEADLDTILKDRMVTADAEEDDDEVVVTTSDRSDSPDGLQPKRADETLCSSCFLLVRPNAPGCPVEDDNCPIFG